VVKKADRSQRQMMLGRLQFVRAFILILCILTAVRMGWVQMVWGPALSAQAEQQRSRVYNEKARRGEILDRSGKQLAYTMQARSLTVSPNNYRDELPYVARQELAEEDDSFYQQPADKREEQIAKRTKEIMKEVSEEIPKIIADEGAKSGEVKASDILKKLESDSNYEVLVRNVDPDVALMISRQYFGIAADRQEIRQYPNGAIASNVIGKISQDGQGQFGFESANDSLLSGIDGRTVFDVSAQGQVIPGSERDTVGATDGAQVTLTLDLDLQTYVQQQLEQQRTAPRPKTAREQRHLTIAQAHRVSGSLNQGYLKIFIKTIQQVANLTCQTMKPQKRREIFQRLHDANPNPTWTESPNEIANRIVRGLYPETAAAVAKTEEILETELPGALHRVLLECKDQVQRQLAAQEFNNSAS